MTLYMLDTNAASEIVRGNRAFDERLQALATGRWCISAITRSEIRYGAALLPQAVKLHRLVDEFLRIAPTLGWDARAAERHGLLRAELRMRGKPIGHFDEMIAAHALATDAVMVTDNVRHFSLVPGLVIDNWLRPSTGDH